MKRMIPLGIGCLLLFHRWTVVAGLCLILIAVGVMIRIYLAQMQEILLEEADERADRLAEERFRQMVANTEYRVSFRQFVGLGKGFDDDHSDYSSNHRIHRS